GDLQAGVHITGRGILAHAVKDYDFQARLIQRPAGARDMACCDDMDVRDKERPAPGEIARQLSQAIYRIQAENHARARLRVKTEKCRCHRWLLARLSLWYWCALDRPAPIEKLEQVALMGLVPLHARGRQRPDIKPGDER